MLFWTESSEKLCEDLGTRLIIPSVLCFYSLQAYLFEYDSTQGRFKGEVKVEGGKLIINGQSIEVFAM